LGIRAVEGVGHDIGGVDDIVEESSSKTRWLTRQKPSPTTFHDGVWGTESDDRKAGRGIG
jgi:hypothetical protein